METGMKKILITLVLVAYAVSSFVFTKHFEKREMVNINFSDRNGIQVVELNKDERPEDKLRKIEELSKKEKINIYKLSYKPIKTSKKQKVIIYAAIGDETQFKQKYPLEWGKIFNQDHSVASYLSSRDTKDKEQVGKINMFSPELMVEIKPIEAAKDENLRGAYFVDSNNPNVVQKVKEKLNTEIGFKTEESERAGAMNILENQGVDKYFIIVLTIVLLLIFLSFLYYILLNYKSLAIRKLFGYTDRELIFKHLLKESIQIHTLSLMVVIIGQVIYLFFYNGMSKFLDFGSTWIVWQLIFSGISILVSLLPSLMIYHIKILELLKNKKPLKLVQFLNYSSKFIFSIFLIIFSFNLINYYQDLSVQNSNQEKWDTTKNYSFYEYQSNIIGDRTNWEYETGIKSKKLFGITNQKGALLIKPSDGITYKKQLEYNNSLNNTIGDVKEYDPHGGNTLQVNSNYLHDNPVYDLNGEKINIDADYGDYLVILVPNKYRSNEADILKIYKEWYQFTRFIDEDKHKESIGEKIEPHKQVEIKLTYIQDNQKHFLYNPMLEVKNQNYSKGAILIVVNSENMGGDSYLSYLTGRYFFPKVDNPSQPYKELKEDIKIAGLQDIILTTPSLYSIVDDYLFKLKSELQFTLLFVTLLLSIEIIITCFTILNYLERNKFIHAVQRINGFDFYKRHSKICFLLSLFWLIIYLGALTFKLATYTIISLIIPTYWLVELLIVYFIIRFVEKKKNKDVLKGA
ncbi:DUF1430 domain-containing protein [Bacillus toyonensis]|nr:DUF1430 domain-containing protein [Bacillus toyonensis]